MDSTLKNKISAALSFEIYDDIFYFGGDVTTEIEDELFVDEKNNCTQSVTSWI